VIGPRPQPRPGELAAVAVFVAAVGLVPLALDSFQAFQFAYVAIYFVAIAGLNILTGYTGQISLGHGAFMAIGGYTTAILVADHGWPELATIPLAGLVAGAAGILFGIPATRLSGLYLALATFGIAIATPAVLKEYDGLTGGVVGKTLPLHGNDWLYYVNWAVALILLAVAWLVVSGKLGRAFRALRDSEVAAASSGIDLARHKTAAFGVSAFYAGVAGSMLAITVAFVNPDTYPVKLSIFLVVGAVASGLGSLWGIAFGAALIEFLPVHAQDISRTAPDVIFGAVLIAVMILLPAGVAPLIKRLVGSISRTSAGRRAARSPAGS
jgi:branched-chain amino acid transport system permease protein